MGLRIATNVASLSASRHLNTSQAEQSKTLERIASGKRITQAADDAAGLSISENLQAQIRSTGQATRNANDGISFAQVAEGSMTEISNIMIRLRELAIQAGSDTVSDVERGFIQKETQSLTQEVDRIANTSQFNGVSLLNAQASKGELEIQVGIQNRESDRIVFDTQNLDVRASTLGIDNLNYESIGSARDGLEKIDSAMTKVSGSRSSLGAIQNRLQSSVRNLETSQESLSISRSRIADADLAKETAELAKGNILQAAGISVLAQANSLPNQVLKLI